MFAKKEFLEIMDNNWPTIMEQYYWKDVSEVFPNCSDEEISELRRKGYSIGAYNVNGKAIRSPGIGISSTGQNIQVIRKANEVCRYLHESCEELENETGIKQKLSKKTDRIIDEISPSIQLIDEWPFFALFEGNSKHYIEKDKLIELIQH